MRGGDGKDTAGFIGKHVSQTADFTGFAQNALGNGEKYLVWFRHVEQTFTVSNINFKNFVRGVNSLPK